MNLSAAFNIISSSFAANAAQVAVVSNNIANVNTTGYSKEAANLLTNSYGGVEVASVTRLANAALTEQVSTSTAQAAAQQAIANGLATLAATVDDSSTTSSTSGASANGASPSAMLANLQSALTTYEDSPTSSSAADAAVAAAKTLTTSLNTGDAAVNQVRVQADQNMASSVSTITSLLGQFQTANDSVVSGLASGANVATAEDARDSLVTQLAQQIGVTTSTAANGSMSIFTDSGVTLFQDTARTVSFNPTTTYVDGTTGNAVTVDGVPITGSSQSIQSGALAGYAELRDTLAPQYQTQLDQIAGGLINAFGEAKTGSTTATMPGLFATATASGLPSPTDTTGLAGAIEINASVDPSQGGNATLLRDGGIAGAAYVYNTSGDASYTDRLQQLVGAIGSTTQTFDNKNTDLGGSPSTDTTIFSTDPTMTVSLTDYANASVSWLQSQNSQATNAADYQNALAAQATSALSNATGINLDAEMTNMLSLENTYESSAKLLTTVNAMFSALLQAA